MAEKTFKEQMAEERKYYMRKTNKIPGSDKTVKEAKADYEKQVAKADQEEAAKRAEWLKSQPVDAETRTTAVTHDTVRTDTVVAGEPAPAAADPQPEKLTAAGLKKKSKAELVTIATDLGVPVVPDSQNMDEIIAAILAK